MSKPKFKRNDRRKKSIGRRKKSIGGRRKKTKNVKSKNKKPIRFNRAVSRIKKHVLEGKPNTVADAIKIALKSAKSMEKKIKPTRIVNVPKTGGILPLIPIFAGLSALGTLTGGAAAIAKAVNSVKSAKEELEEAKRHNKSMEAIAIGKGLYLRPYKTGLGLFLHPAKAKN